MELFAISPKQNVLLCFLLTFPQIIIPLFSKWPTKLEFCAFHGSCLLRFITFRKRNLGQANTFTSVCHSFCPRGWGICMGGRLHPSPSPSDTMGYGQHANSAHPTGMHSCCFVQKSWNAVMDEEDNVTWITLIKKIGYSYQFDQKYPMIHNYC